MQVNKNKITQFLTSTNTCFMIPVYQRNYDWNEDNCKQLWNDIWYISQFPEKTHFLGTICSKTVNGYEKTIIDGQQRITTISLLVKAMHDYVDNRDFKYDLDSNFLHNNGYGVTFEHKVKLHLNTRDDAIYNVLLNYSTHVLSENLTEDEAESHIYCNYEYFYHCLSDLNEIQIGSIRSALDRLIIVDLDVENENPQEIFESLNSTGLDLTNVDLLRNYLLMSLDHQTQERLYNEYWYKIEVNVRPENMVRFFIDYLIFIKRSDNLTIYGRRAHINEKTLYRAFKDHYQDQLNASDSNEAIATELILKDMYKCSTYYKRLVFKNSVDMNSLDEMDQILYSILYINKAVTSSPVLMYIMEKYMNGLIDEDKTKELLKICLSFVFRSKVVGFTGISGQFAGNVLQRLPVSEDMTSITDAFWDAITSGSGKFSFPTDVIFKDALMRRQIFDVLRAAGTKYLFYSLEQHQSNSFKGLPRYDDTDITVEHIMPKTLSSEWQEYMGDDVGYHDDYLNRLGNLTLTTYNSEMSNHTFDEKQNWYSDSCFSYTRKLADLESWSINQIRKRGVRIAEKCVEIWAFPQKYQSKVINNDYPIGFQKKKRTPFRFSMIGISEGEEISFIENPSKIAIVADDAHVIYNGQKYSLSLLAAKFLGRDKSDGISGPSYFTYQGQTLDEIRDEVESNLY